MIVKIKHPLVIDISLWEPLIYWERLDPQPDGVIMKASQNNFIDPSVKQHCSDLSTRTYKRGLYHFLVQDDIAKQVKTYLDLCREVGALDGDTWLFEFPPVLDVEVKYTISREKAAGQVKAWLDAVESATHRKPMIYTSQNFWNNYICSLLLFQTIPPKWTSDYPLWVAQYYNNPDLHDEPAPLPMGWTDWVGWQYYDAYVFPNNAIPFNGCDVNVFKREYLDAIENPHPRGSKMIMDGTLFTEQT